MTIRPLLIGLLLMSASFGGSGMLHAQDPKDIQEAATKSAVEALEEAESEAGGGTSFIDLPARWDLSIYTLIVFGLLFWLLSRFAWPKIQEGLQKREEAIAAARDEAIIARREAEELRVKLQADMAQAQDQVRQLLEEARRDAEALRVREREAGEKDAQLERERAKREIEQAKETALKEIYHYVVELAAMMSEKSLGRNISAEDHKRLLDESLAELSKMTSPGTSA